MRVLLDTNVVLDVLLRRAPWVRDAAAVWQANDDRRITAHVLASALTDVALEQADALPGDDFEDNLQIAVASIAGLDAIITRNKADFKGAPMPVMTPAELMAQLEPLSS